MAGILEQEGFSTVIVMTVKEVAEIMRPPRTVYVRFPIGLTLGAPAAAAQQRVVVEDALVWLERAPEPGSLRALPYRWNDVDYERILAERHPASASVER